MTVDDFNEFENKYNLYDLNIDGFCLWLYLRFELYYAIGENFGITNGQGSTPRVSIKDKLSMFVNSFVANPVFFTSRCDILFIPHQRRILDGDSYRCIYTDIIAEAMSDKALSAEFLFGHMHFKPATTRHLVYMDYVDVIPGIIYKMSIKKNKEITQLSRYIKSSIKDYFRVEISNDYIESLITKRLLYYKYKKRLLRSFLKRVSPRVIVETVGYETNKMVLNEVASEMHIPCVELQHGVIGRGHIAYNYSTNRRFEQLPTHLFVYSDYWKNTCRFPIESNNIIATGFPYLEEQVSKYPYIQNDNNTIRIIVYSSTDSTDSILEFTQELIGVLEAEGAQFSIVYKLHPLEYNYSMSKWDSIRNHNNVVFVNTPTKSLYELCSRSDIQVGVKTTAIFEGLYYGLDTFILDTGASDIDNYMGDLVHLGYAVYGKDAYDFYKHMIVQREQRINTRTTNEAWFVENSKQKIIEELERIVES